MKRCNFIVVIILKSCTASNVGLRLNMERNTLKCYMGDTGLLISHAFDEKGILFLPLYMAPLI